MHFKDVQVSAQLPLALALRETQLRDGFVGTGVDRGQQALSQSICRCCLDWK